MTWLKSVLYTWYKVFGVSSPDDIVAERKSRNGEWRTTPAKLPQPIFKFRFKSR
jgi:hypothetical protein